MVPNFALSLSFDGIALLRRAVTGWMQIDRVAFDDAALDQSLAALRSRATALSADGAQVLLVLPSEQIRFLDIADPGPDDAAREAAVRAALDGATPYAVDELRYDWALRGDRLCAAAVALETLAEAESFVQAHGFTAMAFTTVPPQGAFEGTVWFGTAPGWSGATPERLRTPIEIVDAVPDVPWGAAARRTPDVPPAPVAPDTAEVDKTAPESAPAPDLPAADSAVATPEPGADNADARTPSPDTAPAAPKRPVSAEDGTSGPEDAAPSEAEVPPLPAKRTVLPAPSADSEPPATPSFSSIRASRTAPTSASAPSLSATPAATASGSAPSVLAAAPTPNKSPRAISVTPEATRKTPEQAPDKAPEKGLKADIPATAEGAAKPARDPLQVAAMRRDRGEDPGPAKAQAAAASTVIDPEEERRRMTVFGARQQPIGGKPRYLGLMLTAALLLFMAAVAAWATVFLDEGISGLFQTNDEPTAIAANTSDEADSAPADAEPEALLETAALSADPVPDAREETDPEAVAPSDTPAPAAEAISSDEAAASYAATGIWQRAPTAPRQPGGDTVDAVYLSSVDPEVGQFDAIALPPAPGLNDDIALEPVRLPPGPDTRFDLDPLGLVRATPEGAISPDGHRVFTGPPPQRPPQRTVEEPAPEASDAGEGDASEAEADDSPTEAALRAVRPLDRPEDLIEQTERASLGGISRSELSDMRPVRRPESVSARAEEADPEAADDATDTAVAPVPEGIATAVEEALEEPEVPSGTEQAVASSLEPQTRPGNMSSLVQQAARRAPQPAQTASAAPVRTQPAPRVPQNANVAREATTANQINLRDVNLIGVFGSASNRRALVRLSNGRLQNVKVGDRLDGGRVAAIGDSELRVAKSGRNIVLRMPGG
ncbi:hypothetical protein [Salipiger bermudensis]|uniref:hypothetical protein n=1 Tax=Salipiger bermudensis TaxID=344736 RepID=UPI001CD6A28A|nr:hypothetical protein [Salipiger bermudensis]MCA0960583.1 hypothetical protein [Salipiger bermudensis]